MKIYNYHPYYKYFTSCTDADESPLDPGIFLIPAHATTIKPPDFKESEIPIFTENDWEIVTNHAGVYYNKLTHQPFEWNDPFNVPTNGTKKVPPKIEDGYAIMWDDGWKVIEIPPPVELTPEEKLAQAGLTIEELKKLLGLS